MPDQKEKDSQLTTKGAFEAATELQRVGLMVAKSLHDQVSDPKSSATYVGEVLDKLRSGVNVHSLLDTLRNNERNPLDVLQKAHDLSGVKMSSVIGFAADGTIDRYESAILASQVGNARFSSTTVTPEVHKEMATVFAAIEKSQGVKFTDEDKLGLERLETGLRKQMDLMFGAMNPAELKKDPGVEEAKPIKDPYSPRFAGA